MLKTFQNNTFQEPKLINVYFCMCHQSKKTFAVNMPSAQVYISVLIYFNKFALKYSRLICIGF